ncbi:hypothetical protein E2C01_004692 [Portunus trituberculatus]|uniref:Secreted protein n=1 Tax=Portunus trituberculatus TaxID=210409 RepID=A0A5B7CS18_PORTR|nr:hypothetical protein [Portunus trituberculatus]
MHIYILLLYLVVVKFKCDLVTHYNSQAGEASTLGYESTGPSSNLRLLGYLVNGHLGESVKGKLWRRGCHSVLGQQISSTTGAKANETEMSVETTQSNSVCPKLYLNV